MSSTWTERATMKPGLVEWMAWRRYLTATRASSPATYPIIEDAAWLRLQEDLARFAPPLSADRASTPSRRPHAPR
jgi:hypothetical protein